MTASTVQTLGIAGRIVDLSVPRIMGILNVTPDSFYDGKRYATLSAAIEQAGKMIREGADIIDIGGYSTRPGADEISEEDELARVLPVIQEVKKEFPDCLMSIDTFRSNIARKAILAGAAMVNDISGGDLDPEMFRWVATARIPYVLMHTRGTPQNMNQRTQYQHLTREIIDSMHPKIAQLTQLGAKDVMIDPGFGFAKTVEQNFELLSRLSDLHILGKPILAGLSRKSMIWRTLQVKPEEALNGTTALHMIALQKGATFLRVHDVAEAKQCIQLHHKLLTASHR